MKKFKGENLCIPCLIAAFILMLLPWGVSFVTNPDGYSRHVSYKSYIDAVVFGYGNWLPILTLAFTFVTMLSKPWKRHPVLLSFALFFNSMQTFSRCRKPASAINYIIEILLLVALLSCFLGKWEKNEEK